MIGSENPKALIEFYNKVLGKDPDMTDGDWGGWSIGSGYLTVGPHSEVKEKSKEPARIIINFDTKTVKEEFERIKEVGAQVIKEPYEIEGMWIATFADPDGNYFQLTTPWDSN